MSSVTGDCQECSWCCSDSSSSEHKAECKKDGVPFYKRCSVDQAIRCRPRCTDKQYIIVTETLSQTCFDCPHCGVGQGLYPKCQSVLSSKKKSKCQSCILGKNYSDTTDSSSCKPCKVCGVGKKIERSCNATYDTLCGDCDHGFYNESVGDNKEINCQRCSYCCGDGKDIVIPECKAQGMPKNMQCSYTICASAPGSPYKIILIASLAILVAMSLIGIIAFYIKKKCMNNYEKLNNQESQMTPPQGMHKLHQN